MTPKTCTACGGKCCRDDLGYARTHLDWDVGYHGCEDCEDGTVPVPVRTAADERADVIAYLDYARTFPFTYDRTAPAIIDALRELIEQGQHERWAKKEKP